APLALSLWSENQAAEEIALGSNIGVGERPQAVVPQGVWQSARTFGTWSLVGCIVAPAFELAGFEMAPPLWDPPDES
ncbi:MAG: cupin domain-containing protein, partial [Pseudomonadota bacterium]|nr:cupin domain-containing protein [Pseudomonadota bacterium]